MPEKDEKDEKEYFYKKINLIKSVPFIGTGKTKFSFIFLNATKAVF